MSSIRNESWIEKLALGSAQFGLNYGISNTEGITNKNNVKKILEFASNIGIQYVDTAQAYGSSEKVLGELCPDNIEIISKINPKGFNSEDFIKTIDKSLNLLKRESIFGMMFHQVPHFYKGQKYVDEVLKCKESGKIRNYGVSVYSPNDLEEFIGRYGYPDIVQLPYNYFDRRFEYMLSNLSLNGVKVFSRSVFLQGLFFLNIDKLTPHFNSIKLELGEIQALFHSKSELAGALLGFVLSNNHIYQNVIGVNSVEQLKENIDSISDCLVSRELGIRIEENVLNPSLWNKSII